jgi:hypothetical protein
MVAFVGTP